MQSPVLRAEASADIGVPMQASQPWLCTAGCPELEAAAEPRPGVVLADLPLWNDSGQRIPIVFLRLAL